MVKISTIHIFPNKYSIRSRVTQKSLIELSNSMRNSKGNVVPIRVRKISETKYEIVYGYRRWLAAIQEGIFELDCEIVDVSDDEMIVQNILENIHGEPLCPIDRAKAFRILVNEHGYNFLQLGKLCGKTDKWARQQLKILDLPKEIQELVEGVLEPVKNNPARLYEVPQASAVKLFSDPKNLLKPSIAIKIAQRYKEPKKISAWCNAVYKHKMTQNRALKLMDMMDEWEMGNIPDVYPPPNFWLPKGFDSYPNKIEVLLLTSSLNIEIKGKLYGRLDRLAQYYNTYKGDIMMFLASWAFEFGTSRIECLKALDIGLKQIEKLEEPFEKPFELVFNQPKVVSELVFYPPSANPHLMPPITL